MIQAPTMTDPDRIRELVQARVCQEQAAHGTAQDEPRGLKGQFSEQEIMGALSQGEDGDAALFVGLHRDRLLHDHSAGQWYGWAGHYWQPDLIDEAIASVEAVISVYRAEAQRQSWLKHKAESAGQSDRGKAHGAKEEALLRRCRDLHTIRRKQAVLILARSGKDSLGDPGRAWDADPWLVACSNGVIDLRTGKLRRGKPSDRIKTPCPTPFTGLDTPAPAWEKFLAATFQDDSELVAYMGRLLGYGITGSTRDHVHPIFYGKGRNGKGTLLETVKHVLGDLAFKTKAETLLDQGPKASGSADADTLALRGKRIVWASETNEGRRMNAGKLKELSGGDTLNARGVYARYAVEFKPTHLLLLMTNEKPHAPAGDYALWQRLHLIPFSMAFVTNPDPEKSNERKADPDLPEKLKAEASGILAWLVRGCLAWQSDGLNPPQIIRSATKEYQAGEDLVSQFTEERCTVSTLSEVSAGDLYREYRSWAEENGIRSLSNVKFAGQLQERFDRYRDKKGYVYIGLCLNES
ncbi:MAG: hypothetical protein JEY79_19210 [Pseudodesulfovibrio sp.]|nr:hypothetical protein [Pseudodesulfovibrio sp.]